MNKSMEALFTVVGHIIMVFIICALIYGGWRFVRNFNYRFSYKSLIEQQMKPLDSRVEHLEKQMKIMEERYNKSCPQNKIKI